LGCASRWRPKGVSFFESETFIESGGQFSPDGKWIAFQSNESGRFEIYVQPFPGSGPRVLISSDGGVQARWRHDGKELFYLAPDNRLMAVRIQLDPTGGNVTADRPVSLFAGRLPPMAATTVNARHYMVSPDGQRFLTQTVKEVTLPITVILNLKPTP
jgi:Tol biopolymer transport system component